MDSTERRLCAILRHAREKVPFYADRVPPVDDQADPVAVLSCLPVLERADLQRAGSHIHSASGNQHTWRTTSTTGTTGEPVTVVFDTAAQELEYRVLAAHVRRTGVPDSWRTAGLTHVVLHATASSRAFESPWDSGCGMTKWNLTRIWQVDDSGFRQRLSCLDGHLITAKPYVMALIAERLGKQPGFRPAGIVLSGETITLDQRDLIERVFSCPLTSVYTMAEAGILGTECSGAYHVEPETCFAEILDERDERVTTDTVGDLVITTLTNQAMPLVRYRTGDRARWLREECGCGRASPRLVLTSARSATHLMTPTGELIQISRFVKLFTALPVRRISLAQPATNEVRVVYQADYPLDGNDRRRITTEIREAVGLHINISFTHANGATDSDDSAAPTYTRAADGRAEPPELRAHDVAAWLRSRFAESGRTPYAAVLSGSVLDPGIRTRYSDIDLTVLTDDSIDAWPEFVRELRQELPRLRVSVERAAGLADRAPLVTCRLQCERLDVVGCFPTAVIGWPSRDALCSEARGWSRNAAAVLWHQLTDPRISAADPIQTAYLAQKTIVDACRYRHLCAGGRRTHADLVTEVELGGAVRRLAGESIAVAREHQPPPIEPASGLRYLITAHHIVEQTAAALV